MCRVEGHLNAAGPKDQVNNAGSSVFVHCRVTWRNLYASKVQAKHGHQTNSYTDPKSCTDPNNYTDPDSCTDLGHRRHCRKMHGIEC